MWLTFYNVQGSPPQQRIFELRMSVVWKYSGDMLRAPGDFLKWAWKGKTPVSVTELFSVESQCFGIIMLPSHLELPRSHLSQKYAQEETHCDVACFSILHHLMPWTSDGHFNTGWSSGLWALHEFCLKILEFKKNLRVLESKPMDNLLPTPLDILVI